MKLSPHGLGTRIARRLVGLFLLCALLPVTLAIFASYHRVQAMLVGERLAQLEQAAAGYGNALVERLQLADSLARSIAASLPRTRPLDDVRRQFRTVVVYAEDGTPNVLLDAGGAVPRRAALRLQPDHLAAGGTQLVLHDVRGARQVWLVRQLARGAGGGLLAMQLRGDFLWSDSSAIPNAARLCVLDQDRRPLHCAGDLSVAALDALRAQLDAGPSGSLGWREGGAASLGGFRAVPLDARFRAERWPVLLWQPAQQALAPIAQLRDVVLPLTVLGMLCAALIGFTQVRRIMNPLQQLAAATRRIAARDFGARIDVHANDEFGELADAFNAMSDRLGRQFHALGALAQIDSVILSKVDIDRIGAIVVGRMREVVHGRAWMLLLPEESRPGHFYARTADSSAGSLTGREFALSEREMEELARAPQGVAMGPNTVRPTIPSLTSVDPEDMFVLPILLEGQLGGMIVVGGTRRGGPEADEVALLQDLGDRVAVALATAARDRELYRRAHFDPLTQLPNRLLFLDELGRELSRAERHGTKLAVLFLDLDGFSSINDTLGHAVGDELLVHVAARLRGCLRKSDLVARLGGDEFTVVLSEVREAEDVPTVAQHLIDVLSQPYDVGHGDTYVTASVGIAIYPTDGASPQELLQHADMAMYRAKGRGRAGHVFFEEEMNREAQQRYALDRELRHALEAGQFVLHYQPQFDLRANRIVGAEALIRWQHPTRGLVAPGPFIGFAEETGLIEKIGEWALREACRQFMAWRADSLPLEHVSVNVSPRQFRGRDFVETIARSLDDASMPAQRLRLEITESVLVDDSGNADTILARLRVLGTPLELDDFGTGYSSLAYLQRLPVGTIKLDRSFTADIAESDNARAIARAAIDMVHALKKEIVAEGVETAEQLALLRRWGCDAIQGFLLSRPLPAVQFAEFVRGTSSPTTRGTVRLVHNSAA